VGVAIFERRPAAAHDLLSHGQIQNIALGKLRRMIARSETVDPEPAPQPTAVEPIRRSAHTYPGPPGVTDQYSGRYRVMGRNEFYIIRAPLTPKYLRYEALRRERDRPRQWPRVLGDDPYWERRRGRGL